MEKFVITKNNFLKKNTQAYYHFDYTTYGTEGNPDFINHLKNQFGNTNSSILKKAKDELKNILREDLASIWEDLNRIICIYTVCVIPRAKAENQYQSNQKLFKLAVKEIIEEYDDLFDYSTGFIDGTNYLIRHINTRTTHMARSEYGGDGDMPYVGITKATCFISNKVRGKNILLIDDIYTKDVNIDEDAIQALLDNGAKSVTFYAVAKTYKGRNETVNKQENLELKPFLKETYHYLKNEKDLQKVAFLRGCTIGTIVNHIVEIAEILGSDTVKKFQPPTNTILTVKRAVNKLGVKDKLKPIYEELGEQISYNDIKLSLIFID